MSGEIFQKYVVFGYSLYKREHTPKAIRLSSSTIVIPVQLKEICSYQIIQTTKVCVGVAIEVREVVPESYYASGADTTIVKAALEIMDDKPLTVNPGDTDMFCLFIHHVHMATESSDIFLKIMNRKKASDQRVCYRI